MTEETDILDAIKDCFSNLEGPDKIKELILKAFDLNVDESKLINSMKDGLDEVGKKYDNSEYFLSDLVMSGVMANELTDLVKPRLQANESKPIGKVIIGTVKGDIHDIGKNLVINILSTQGFEVIDVGVDIAPEKFLESVQEKKPDILAMSCLLTAGMVELSNTVKMINEKEPKVKTIIGGRPLTQDFADEIGADAYGKDAFEAVNIAKNFVGER